MRALLALLIAVAGCAAPSAVVGSPSLAGSEAASFRYDGRGCVEFVVGLVVDAAQARGFVPVGYAILGEAAGRAHVLITYLPCESMVLDGHDIGPGVLGNVGVVIEPQGEGSTVEYYQLAQPMDNAELVARFRGLGAPHWLAGMEGGEAADTLATGSFDAWVALPETEYGLRGTFASVGVEVPQHVGIAWHDGARGTIQMTYTVLAPVATHAPVDVAVDAKPGSFIARLVAGGTPGVSGVQRFDFDGEIELVG